MVSVRSRKKRRAVRITAGFTSKLNLAVDLSLIALAAWTAQAWRGGLNESELRALLSLCAALASTWVVTAAALRHYSMNAYERTSMDDTAMVTAQVSAVATVLAVLEVLAPAGARLPPIGLTMTLLWSPVLLLRLLVFR